MKHPWLLLAAIIYLSALSHAADPAADFSGIWRLDPKATKIDLAGPADGKLHFTIDDGRTTVRKPGDAVPEMLPESPPAGRIMRMTMKITQTDNEIQIERQFTLDGTERHILQKVSLDGSQCLNLSSDGTGEFISRSSLKDSKLIQTGIQKLMMRFASVEAHVMEEYSLSRKGRKLTIRTRSTVPQGSIKINQEFVREEKETAKTEDTQRTK